MKRIFIPILLILWFATPLAAQGLRQSVCVVYPEYTEKEKNTMGDYALYLARAGYRSASRQLTTYRSNDMFGSGVVVEDQGHKFILTNRHVTGYAQTATIVFQLHDKNVRYEHCKVIGSSLSSDLAAIELPDDCPQVPLPLSTTVIDDGLSIVAAGFPGLGAKASWQMTQGIISNASMRHEDLGNQTLIQHTAPIDPGSSGGPLLVKENGKYHIAGINTWKAVDRENVGIAIPVTDVATFLYELDTPDQTDQQVLAQLENRSAEEWSRMYAHLPDSTREQLREQEWSLPMDIVFSADREQERLDSQKAARKSHSNKKGTTKNGSTKNSGRRQATTVRIDTDLNNPNAAGIYYDYLSATTHEVAVFYEHQWWGVLVTDIHIGSLIAEANVAGYNFWDSTPQWKTIGGVVFGGTLGAQLPITINRFLLCPRVTQSFTGGPMIGADHAKIALLLDTRAGLDFRFPVGNVELVVGAHYTFNYSFCGLPFRETAYKASTNGSMNHYLHHGFGVKLAVGF